MEVPFGVSVSAWDRRLNCSGPSNRDCNFIEVRLRVDGLIASEKVKFIIPLIRSKESNCNRVGSVTSSMMVTAVPLRAAAAVGCPNISTVAP